MLRNIAKGQVWEFGVSALPAFWPFPHIKLKSRVLFAPPLRDDAGDPFGDARKQHRLRRSVCKGWRNKQWHGRLMAFIEMLSGESASIGCRLARQRQSGLKPRPFCFRRPSVHRFRTPWQTTRRNRTLQRSAALSPRKKSHEVSRPYAPRFSFNEPLLEFGSRQTTAHPKDGLFLYGPLNKRKKTREVRIGVIGTPAGINHFRSWAAQIKKLVSVPPPGKTEKKDRLHLANFPGMEETFKVSFNDADFVTYPLEPRAIDTATRILNLHEAVSKVVKLYTDKARRHMDNEERAVDVWVLVVPEIIFERCRPQSKRTDLPIEKGDFGKKQSTRSDLPLLDDIVDRESEDIFDDVPDFHRQVKAEFLTISPTQLLRETTLEPDAFKNRSGNPSGAHKTVPRSRGI